VLVTSPALPDVGRGHLVLAATSGMRLAAMGEPSPCNGVPALAGGEACYIAASVKLLSHAVASWSL